MNNDQRNELAREIERVIVNGNLLTRRELAYRVLIRIDGMGYEVVNRAEMQDQLLAIAKEMGREIEELERKL